MHQYWLFKKVCNSKKSEKPPQAGCLTLNSNPPTRIAGIEETNLIEAGIERSVIKKEIFISIFLPDRGLQKYTPFRAKCTFLCCNISQATSSFVVMLLT